MRDAKTDGYGDLLARIRFAIRLRQADALRVVNRELVGLYWQLGEAIHRKQEETGWGDALLESLSRALMAEFPGRSGFSVANLRAMRELHAAYKDKAVLLSWVREVSWSKNLVILRRCRSDAEREFYLKASARLSWTLAELRRHVEARSYEHYLLEQADFEGAPPGPLDAKVAESLKDAYAADFLALSAEAAA